MGKTNIQILIDEGLVSSKIENFNSNIVDWSLALSELELVKLQILNLIQKQRKSKNKEW
jgi:hypothetical protein